MSMLKIASYVFIFFAFFFGIVYLTRTYVKDAGIVSGVQVVNGQEVFTMNPGQKGEVHCAGTQLKTRWLDFNTTTRRGTKLEVTCVAGTTVTPTPVPTVTVTPSPAPTVTTTPTPIPSPTPTGVSNAVTFPSINPLALGTCSAEVHDKYFVVGPDGNKYRTWHPVKDPSGCTFAHEHGDAPHPNGPKPAFGYASMVHGMTSEIAAHQGFKVFTHYKGNKSGFGTTELDYGGVDMNFTFMIHQGSAGAARVTERFHSMEFWSDQGGTTQIYVMADTGPSLDKAVDGDRTTFGRLLASHDATTYETWAFSTNIGGVWTTGDLFAAITNPMNHMHDIVRNSDGTVKSAVLRPTSLEFCFLSGNPCEYPFGSSDDNSYWLGNLRTVHEPDFTWTNSGKVSEFCTTTMGERTTCGAGTIKQRVASINLSNVSARLLDRTSNSGGFDNVNHLPVGAPGGN